ncbi:MAG TPA: AlpA family phage regulatory protein [Burkholderiaceae bacterium]
MSSLHLHFMTDPAVPSAFFREAQLVPNVIPVSPATLWRWVREGNFPKPVRLSSRITAWRVEDVERWIASRTPESIDEAE